MDIKCPKCGANVADTSIYCPNCGHGLKPSARTSQVSAAGTLLIASAISAFIFFLLSVRALSQLQSWYPAAVAESWIAYDRILTGVSFAGFLFGFASGLLSLTRRKYNLTIICAFLCTFSGASAWTISMIIPLANAWYSFLYYFLPTFTTALIGTALIYPRKAEFKP